ncbi:hypothetical protein L195_g061338, partial [Trifolium pratense]
GSDLVLVQISDFGVGVAVVSFVWCGGGGWGFLVLRWWSCRTCSGEFSV